MSFLLVHGAGFGASCWDRLIPLLPAPVLATDLPGRGARAGADLRTVTLDDCASAVVEDAERAGLGDIVLVAHSFAGVTTPRVMARMAGRLRHVVFLSAVIPPDGSRVIDQIDPGVRAAVEASIAGGIYAQAREGAAAMLCNDLTEDAARWTLDRLTDDSAALLAEPVDLAGLKTDVPRTYVHLSQDHCYPPELQEAASARAGGQRRTLASGHMAMVSVPGQLATLLTDLA